MPVQINELIIRAIITNDDKTNTAKAQPSGKKTDDKEDAKLEVMEWIDEVIKSKKER